MSVTLSALQKQRRDTAANWTAENPTLLAGELALETDTGYWKVGDGSTAWNSLAYITGLGAEIPVSRLADGTARQLLQTAANGTDVEWASNIDVPGTLDVTGAATFDAAVTIQGDLTVNGTTTTIDTQNLIVEDKNVIIGNVTSPTDVTADGGGITLKGATDKTIQWIDSTDAWTFSEHVNIASAKEYRIAGTKVLDATSLGSGVVSSSLTSVGTIATGTWQGTAIASGYGGTGQTTYTDGQLLIGKTDGTLAKATLTASTGVTITNGDGTITISATGSGGTVTSVTATSPIASTGGTTPVISIQAASTTQAGAVQLNDTTTSTSTTQAATANVVKSLADSLILISDVADAALPKAGGTMTGDITLNAQSDLRFADADSSNWVAFQAPATIASNVTWTLPSADGTTGQVLSTNGSGTLSWATAATPDVSLAGNNAFTGANTFTNTTGQIFRPAATQDGVLIRGRAGGTSSYTAEVVPTTLTASRTITLPDATGTVALLGTAQTFTAVQTLTDPAIIGTILEDVFTITDGAAFEIDPGNGSVQLITLGANRTPKATNFAAGEAVTLMVDDGTAYTLTWSDSTFGGTGVVWKTGGGNAPTLNTTGYTVIVLWKVGTQVYGARVGDA